MIIIGRWEKKKRKYSSLNKTLVNTQDQLASMTRERDRYSKELEFAEETIKTKNAHIKRLTTELGVAERTIEEFITWKEKQISSFFDDDTIYTDAKKIESILTSLDETKKEYSWLGKEDISNLPQWRPYLLQKLKQEQLRKIEMDAEKDKEPDLNVLPDEIKKIVKSYKDRSGGEILTKNFDKIMIELNKAYHAIKQDKIMKVKAQLNAEIQYLKRVLALLIPLDKDKARTEIAYLRTELKRAREDIRRLNILVKRKKKGGNNKSIDFDADFKKHVPEDNINDISTEDGYKSSANFIEKALNVAENAINETKDLNNKVGESVRDFKNVKTKNYSTWREEDNPEEMLSEEWLISEINSALKGSNENVQKMMYASRIHLAKSGVELLK